MHKNTKIVIENLQSIQNVRNRKKNAYIQWQGKIYACGVVFWIFLLGITLPSVLITLMLTLGVGVLSAGGTALALTKIEYLWNRISHKTYLLYMLVATVSIPSMIAVSTLGSVWLVWQMLFLSGLSLFGLLRISAYLAPRYCQFDDSHPFFPEIDIKEYENFLFILSDISENEPGYNTSHGYVDREFISHFNLGKKFNSISTLVKMGADINDFPAYAERQKHLEFIKMLEKTYQVGKSIQIHKDVWKTILLEYLPFSSLKMATQVNTESHKYGQEVARINIQKYFLYLQKHQKYHTEPLSIFLKEYRYYALGIGAHRCFVEAPFHTEKIPMVSILSAIKGEMDYILTEKNPNFTRTLYALRILNGHPLPQEGINQEEKIRINGSALIFSSRSGILALVNGFLAIPEISNEDKGEALVEAATNGHLEIVNVLLTCLGISKKKIQLASEEAAKNGHTAIIKALITSTIPGRSRKLGGYACVPAAKYGYFDIVNIIMTTQDVSYNDQYHALEGAVTNGHFEIVKLLLPCIKMNDYIACEALKLAKLNQHEKIEELIYAYLHPYEASLTFAFSSIKSYVSSSICVENSEIKKSAHAKMDI